MKLERLGDRWYRDLWTRSVFLIWRDFVKREVLVISLGFGFKCYNVAAWHHLGFLGLVLDFDGIIQRLLCLDVVVIGFLLKRKGLIIKFLVGEWHYLVIYPVVITRWSNHLRCRLLFHRWYIIKSLIYRALNIRPERACSLLSKCWLNIKSLCKRLIIPH